MKMRKIIIPMTANSVTRVLRAHEINAYEKVKLDL